MKTNIAIIFFSLILSLYVNASDVPSFEPFSYTGSYKIKGVGYNRNQFAPNVTASNNVTLYVDSGNSRILWNNTFSYFLNMANGSYFWGDIIRNFTTGELICLYRPDFNYTRNLYEYSKSFETRELGPISSYFGSVFDYGSCGAKLNHRTDVLNYFGNNVILRQEFAQELFNPFLGTCFSLYGAVLMDFTTLRLPSENEFNTAFKLPQLCLSNTVDYCSYAYPGDLCH